MKFIFLFFVVLFTLSSLACEVTVAPKIIMIGDALTDDSFSFECSQETKSLINTFFANAKGSIKTTTIASLLENNNLIFSENEIQIINFKDLLVEQGHTNPSKLMTFSVPTAPKALRLTNNQILTITNFEPTSHGDLFKINVHENHLLKWTYDGVVHIEKTVKAYTVRKNIPAFTHNISSALFQEIEITPDLVNEYFTDINQMAYFENNKPLKENRPLRKSDFNPINIVRAGNTVEAQLDSENINVKFQAVSRNNGGLGDRVEVYNPKTSIKYNSKIVDFNKVVIEL